MLDLSDVFDAYMPDSWQTQSVLTDIIEGTCGHLRKLSLDNWYVGEGAAQAIAQKCTQLEELSLPGCDGMTDSGVTFIALACKQLQILRIGGWTYQVSAPRLSIAACSALV